MAIEKKSGTPSRTRRPIEVGRPGVNRRDGVAANMGEIVESGQAAETPNS